MLRCLGFGEGEEKVSHVTVSVVRGDKGKDVTCYSLCGLRGDWDRCHMLRFLWFGVVLVGEGGGITCYGYWCTLLMTSLAPVIGAWFCNTGLTVLVAFHVIFCFRIIVFCVGIMLALVAVGAVFCG
jgi:hypothetical protein